MNVVRNEDVEGFDVAVDDAVLMKEGNGSSSFG